MAKKKKSAKNKSGPRKSAARKSSPAPRAEFGLPPIFRSVMEDVFGAAPRGDSAAERRAEDLVDQAMQAPPRKSQELLAAALKLDPNCVDAHVMLGSLSLSIEQAIEHFRRGVEAGERSLQKDWQDYVGHF